MGIVMSNTDCFDTFTISYRVKIDEEGNNGSKAWKTVDSKKDAWYIEFNNLQPNSTYQVNMTAKLTASGQVITPIFVLKEFKTLEKGTTVLTTPKPRITTTAKELVPRINPTTQS